MVLQAGQAEVKIIGWKIYYSDKSINSKEMEWADAPDDDVQFVILFFQTIRQNGKRDKSVIGGHDYYFMIEDGTIGGITAWELMHIDKPYYEAIRDRYPNAIIKRGKLMNYNEFNKLNQLVYSDDGDFLR